MDEKCFCHLNGYKVKDAEARAHMANKNNPHGITVAQIGAAPAKSCRQNNPDTAGWYRVGRISMYFCYRLYVSSRFSNTRDMGAVIDICATNTNPALIKTASSFTNSGIKVVDQVRLVKDGEGYYVDINYTQNLANTVTVLLEGVDAYLQAYENWYANPAGTAVVTLSL